MRKLTFVNAVCLLLSVLLLTGIGGCTAQNPVAPVEKPVPNDITGKWRGATEDDIVVELTVTKAKDDTHKASVHYDPQACSIEANEVRKTNDTVLFRFDQKTATDRKFCFELGNKKMTLKREGEGLRMDVKSEDDTIEQTVLLKGG